MAVKPSNCVPTKLLSLVLLCFDFDHLGQSVSLLCHGGETPAMLTLQLAAVSVNLTPFNLHESLCQSELESGLRLLAGPDAD